MHRKHLTMLAIGGWLLVSGTAYAQPLILNEDTVIDAPVNGRVWVMDGDNDATHVDIVEGGVATGGLSLQGFSEVILNGGDVTYTISLFDDSFLTINSGTVACTDPICEVSLLVGLINARDRARVDFYGGVVEGQSYAEVVLRDNSQARVFGSNLTATSDGEIVQVTGVYLSGEPIELIIWQRGGGTTLQLIEVPEPTGAVLVMGLLAGFASRRRMKPSTRPHLTRTSPG